MNKTYVSTGRKNQKLKTRQKILLTAQKFLAQSKDFTLEDVAQKAQISRATIYRYYSNIDVLNGEAGLDLNTQSPEDIYKKVENLPVPERILGIQEYFDNLAITNESAFRKYLSTVLTATVPTRKRGARRIKTLRLALASEAINLTKTEIENLTYVATVLMGIEALVVTKDVCNLNNTQSTEVLKWGLEMVIKGMFTDKAEN